MFDEEQLDGDVPAEETSVQVDDDVPAEEASAQLDEGESRLPGTVVVEKDGLLQKVGGTVVKVGGAVGQAAAGAAGAVGGVAKKAGGGIKSAAQGAGEAAGSAVGAVRERVGRGTADDEDADDADDVGVESSADAPLEDDGVQAVLVMPDPMLDAREERSLELLCERYEKLQKPNVLAKVGKKAGELVPGVVKEGLAGAAETISEQELYGKLMETLASGFTALEEQAARVTTSEHTVLKRANAVSDGQVFTELGHLCFLRSYNVEKIADKDRVGHLASAAAEGAATGAAGVVGIPFNIVLSTFLYYRSIQSIAMCYGYDTRNDPAELQVASDVFAAAFGVEEGTGHIAKFMAYGQLAAAQDAAKKGWTAMAQSGRLALLATQIRALANKSAAKALENAGKETLEKHMFSELLEQIGKKLTLKATGRAVPVLGAAVGLLSDTATMKSVLEYADIFYNKRFLVEKEQRVAEYMPMEASVSLVEVPCTCDDA